MSMLDPTREEAPPRIAKRDHSPETSRLKKDHYMTETEPIWLIKGGCFQGQGVDVG